MDKCQSAVLPVKVFSADAKVATSGDTPPGHDTHRLAGTASLPFRQPLHTSQDTMLEVKYIQVVLLACLALHICVTTPDCASEIRRKDEISFCPVSAEHHYDG